jgi:hypothetical protein
MFCNETTVLSGNFRSVIILCVSHTENQKIKRTERTMCVCVCVCAGALTTIILALENKLLALVPLPPSRKIRAEN